MEECKIFTFVGGGAKWRLYNPQSELILTAGGDSSFLMKMLNESGMSYRIISDEDWRLIHGELQTEEQSIQ